MNKWLDRYENGGLVSKNSLNRTVTCSNCGWSWKLSDGGEDPLTCHKCGGTIKMKHGGVIEDDMGQWAHPGQVTRINSNEITMEGVPYPVLGVDDTGYTQMMQPEMNYTFPGQYVTEYPMMQYGGLTKYKEGEEVVNPNNPVQLKNVNFVYKKPEKNNSPYNYTPQNFVTPNPNFNNIPTQTSYAEVPFINKDLIESQIYTNDQFNKGKNFYELWMNSPRYKEMLTDSDPVNAKIINQNRFNNLKKAKINYINTQPKGKPLIGAEAYNIDGHIDVYPRGVSENVSNLGTHEISHVTDRNETGLNVNRNIPINDINKINLYSNLVKTKPNYTNALAEWRYKNDPKFYNYVAKPTETRARLNDIRQKAYENKLYDPFTQKVDANTFNKLLKFKFEKNKEWNPLYQLQNVYTNDQIIDLLNTVSKNDNAPINTEDPNTNGLLMKHGGQHGGLDRWFAEKWVDIKTGKPCGRQEGEDRNYPACRPSKRISSDTPKTSSELSSSERERFKQEKTSSQRISYNHKKMEYGGQNINNINYMKSGGNVPTNPELWSRAKSAARSKYDVYPSAYANGFASKWYKQRGGGWRKAEYGMEVMGNGGVPTNPGFNALPEYVQQNIINNMATGGQKMPPELAYARFAAAGNLDQLGKYGYEDGGEEEGKKEVYWRTKQPMVNDPSMDAISKVLLQRNQDKNFMQRAAGFGNQNSIPTKYIDGENPNSNDMSTLLMGFGDNYVSPSIIETFSNPLRNNSTMLRTAPGQLIYQPDQMEEYIKTPTVDVSDYFAAKGYKRAANDMYGMKYQTGGDVPTIEGPSGYMNEDDVWIVDNETIKRQAKELGAKRVLTEGGSLVIFDDNWNIVAGDDNPNAPYKQGGEKLPNDFNKFQEFNKTLPNNLRDDDFKYGDYSHYDLYGMWDAAGKPNSFNDVKDTENFPLQEDNTYHGFSVGNNGIWLKPKSHPSAWMEFMQGQLSTDPYFKDNHVIQREDGRLQYVPKTYMKKQGGSVTLNTGGENHRIYVKSTNRGEGDKGHIMVNHPTMDKGMWDTIDLTKKSGATTIAQGVAATKKWHRENPYTKEYGGDVLMYADGGSFKESFRKARINNKSNFVYNGKTYSTDLKKPEIIPVKTITSNPYAFNNSPIIENTNPVKRKPVVQNVWINPNTGLPMTKDQTVMATAQQIAQNKNSGSISKTVPTSIGRRTLDVLSNPMTSAQQLITKQPITGRGPRNILDNAVDLVNPITYAKAIKNTATNVVHPIETLKKLGNAGLGTLQYITEGNTNIPVGEGYGVLFDGLMTAGALKGVNKFANQTSTKLRDAKFNNSVVTKKGNTVKNSKEFFEQHDGKPLSQKEKTFLNNELKQRGILEIQRKNVLNPIPNIFKKGVVAEDYNIKKVIKDFVPNLIKGQKYVDNQYTMGNVRLNAVNQWLGLPSKNTAYRIHSNSFKNGNKLIYTVPEKNVNYNNENLSKFNNQQLNNVNAIEAYYRNPTKANKKILYKAMSEENVMTEKYKDFDPDTFLKNPDNTYGRPILLENKTVIPTYDYITGTGGGAPIIKEGNKITLKDTWDIQPFSRSTKLPKFIQNIDVADAIGAKNFTLNQTYRGYPYGIKQTYDNGGIVNYAEGGGIPERYRNMGFTNVGAKKQSTRPGKKWMVLAKKGDDYKVVHGGYKGMQDFKQHHSEQRKENFWSRMGGRNSAKATDPFSPLYWHKRFGTWEYGGQPMAVGGQNVMNPIIKKDNRNWLEYLKN